MTVYMYMDGDGDGDDDLRLSKIDEGTFELLACFRRY